MRIHLHDFSGHPFQVQLARKLASRGHHVLYSYCSQYVTGRGHLEVRDDDPPTLRIKAVTAKRPLQKYALLKRLAWEISYAQAWIEACEPDADVVIACNIPLVAHARVQRFLSKRRIPVIFWHQDLYSLAMSDEMTRRLGRAATPVNRAFEAMEKRIVATSTAVVAIGEQFRQQYMRWGLSTTHVSVIPNWAPLDTIFPAPRSNSWTARLGVESRSFRLMYTGTLGRKHNPQLLIGLVDELRGQGVDAELVVVSEGVGSDDIRASTGNRPYVRVLPFQAAADLSEMMGAADVLVAILDPNASQFSVPSKVLSYLAAGRPIVVLAPADNPAAADVAHVGGHVAPANAEGVADATAWLTKLSSDSDRMVSLGRRARGYAEERFDVDKITDEFESVLQRTQHRVTGATPATTLAAPTPPTSPESVREFL